MTNSEATMLLHRLMIAIQCLRSIACENGHTDEFLTLLDHWTYGELPLLLALERILRRPVISPADFYNMMLCCALSPMLRNYGSFPEPDLAWFQEMTINAEREV